MEAESLEQMQARHRKELRELQHRITNKKKTATKRTRKGVNDECAAMEQQLRERQTAQVAALDGPARDGGEGEGEGGETAQAIGTETTQASGTETARASGIEELGQGVHEAPGGTRDKVDVADGAASQPARKRNRQKERLARRAAEQQAAVQRAEDEAGAMADLRAREGSNMKAMFQQYGLVEKAIEPDGHCLFTAFADQLAQSGIALGAPGAGEPAYRTVRRAAAAYMLENPQEFAPFLDEDLQAYAGRMRDTAEWGGQLELTALARRYGAEVRVVQDGRVEKIGEEEGWATGKTLWLAYYRHGFGLGEHYNSLRNKTGP